MELNGNLNYYNMNSYKAEKAYANQNIISENINEKNNMNLKALNNLKVGDLFKGHIMDIQGEVVKIILSDGVITDENIINAKIQKNLSDISLNIGQDIIFKVNENNNGKLSIKPVEIDKYPAKLITKVLDGANLSPSEKNIEIIKDLIDNGLPLDKNTLSDIISKIQKFPDENSHNIMKLYKFSIPVTKENLEQIKNYTELDNRITSQIDKIYNETINILQNQTRYNRTDIMNFSCKIIDLLKEDKLSGSINYSDNLAEKFNDANENTVFSLIKENSQNKGNNLIIENAKINNQILEENSSDSEINNYNNKNNITRFEALDNKIFIIKEYLKDESIALKDKLQVLKNIINLPEDSLKNNEFSEILGLKETKNIIKEAFDKKFSLNPEKFLLANNKKEEIKSLYHRIISGGDEIIKISNELENNSNLSKLGSELKDNITFINDINYNNAYVQIPVKLTDETGNSELYVYNRTNRIIGENDILKAFLHFDLNSLGATDIYVSLKNNSVNIKFNIDNEDSVKLVELHFNELKKALEKRGYIAELGAELIKENDTAFNKLSEQINNEKSITCYSFDVSR